MTQTAISVSTSKARAMVGGRWSIVQSGGVVPCSLDGKPGQLWKVETNWYRWRADEKPTAVSGPYDVVTRPPE